MKLLGLDLETTGLEPEKSKIVEIGAVIWDTELQAPMTIFDEFIFQEAVEPEASKVNGITLEMLKEYGLPEKWIFDRILLMMLDCDAFVAHNGTSFDKPFILHHMANNSLYPPERIWIDTQNDIEFPESIGTRKLTYLAAEHGFLNPFAHRAVFDVLTMMIVLSKYDINRVLWVAKQPTVEVQALVDFHSRQLAKDRSYRWSPERSGWFKTMKKFQLEQEAKEVAFKIRYEELST